MRALFLIVFVAVSTIFTAQAQHKDFSARAIRLDTIRIVVPKQNGFDGLNTRLHNYKMKTPMYNSMLTGTSAPGDVNTGISIDHRASNMPETSDAHRIRIARDSANIIKDSVGLLHK